MARRAKPTLVFVYFYTCICVLVFEYLYLCVQGRQHVIVWSILTNTNHVQTCQHRREPKTAQFSGVELSCFSPQILLSVLHCYTVTNQILLSVLQPFFCRRWVSMAPSCSPNLSLSPPRPAPNYPADPVSQKTCPIFAAFRLWPPAWGEGDKTQRQNCPHPSPNILSEKSDNGLTYKTLSSQIWRLFSSLAFVSLRWWMIDPCFKKRFDNNVSDRLDRGERKTGPILEFEVLPWINLNLVAPSCQRQSAARW